MGFRRAQEVDEGAEISEGLRSAGGRVCPGVGGDGCAESRPSYAREVGPKNGSDTTQPLINRLEGGHARPPMRALEQLAHATGLRLLIRFERSNAKRPAA